MFGVLFLLLVSILLQPVQQALAFDTEEQPATEVAPTPAPEAQPREAEPAVAETVAVAVSDVATDSPSTTATVSNETIQLEDTTAATGTAAVSAEENIISSTTDSSDAGTTETPLVKNAEATATTTDVASELTLEGATTTDATTTEDLPLIHNTYNDNEIRFDKDQCTIVADGSYYCRPKTIDTTVHNGLIAAPDSDGDLEIFAVKDGEYIQLTFNNVDDASPYYDSESDTMVWHRLVDDHYQIYSYDFKTLQESRFTDSDANDMEPTRYGKYTVWQRWVDGYWQVMLDDGDSIKQLSQDHSHNLAPHIRGQIIIWQIRAESGEQELQTYDLLTKEYLTIGDDENASMINPRMMMVYEAVYDTGEVVTRGFDMLTGKVVRLQTSSKPLPEELPKSDSTGETRALIQNSKPGGKELEVDTEPEPLPQLPPLDPTPTSTLTLNLIATTSPVSVGSAVDVPATTTPDINYDLYIPASSTQISLETTI